MQTTISWQQHCRSAVVAGQFSSWQPQSMIQHSNNEWQLTTNLQPGIYQFKFIIDGNWRCSDRYLKTQDGNGNINNQIVVDYQNMSQIQKQQLCKQPVFVTFISDTHEQQQNVTNFLVGGDILLHTGDIVIDSTDESRQYQFLQWFSKQTQYKYRVFIAGNHDEFFEKYPERVEKLLHTFPNIIYLKDCACALPIEGTSKEYQILIYGTPYQQQFCNMAFNLTQENLRDKYNLIPPHVDILMTHDPAFMHNDRDVHGQHTGNQELAQIISKQKPTIHACGHVHEAYGVEKGDRILFVNSALCNLHNQQANLPIFVGIDPDSKTFEVLK